MPERAEERQRVTAEDSEQQMTLHIGVGNPPARQALPTSARQRTGRLEDDEQVLSYVLSLVSDRLRSAAHRVDSEADAHQLADRIASVLPAENPAAEAIGPVFQTSDLTTWLGVSKQAIDNKVRRRDLLALKTSDGYRIYPDWQFDEHGKVLPGVGESIRALTEGGMDPWTQAMWFRGKTSALGGTSAARWLQQSSDPALVVQEARRTANRWSQ